MKQGMPMPTMRSAAPKKFKRGGMVVNPILDMDDINSGASDDEGNESKLSVKTGMASDKGNQPRLSPEAQIFNGLRNARSPRKVTGGTHAMAPNKVSGVGPSSPMSPRKTVVGKPSSKPLKTIVATPQSKPMKAIGGKASNGQRGKMTPRAMRKKHSALFGG